MNVERMLRYVAGLIAVLAIVYVAAAIYIANSALSAERTSLSELPSQFGVAYEEVEFSPRDWPELTLRGWWMPVRESRATVIRIHGLDGNRSSLLGLSAALTRAGFSVLAFDLRGHGRSDDARMGAGIHERDDVLGAIDYVVTRRSKRPDEQSEAIFLHGNSYGGAIALMSGWRDDRVTGVFADSAFASLSDLVSQEVSRRTILPAWAASVLRPGVVLSGRVLFGLDIGDVAPSSDAALYAYPLGLTHCRPDERISLAHFDEIAEAVQIPARSLVFDHCAHSDAWLDDPEAYGLLVVDYFQGRLAVGSGSR